MNGQDVFLWGLEISDTLTMELTSQMTVIALGVATICFICNLSYNYLFHGASQLLTSDENKFPDYMEVARCFALLFCLTLYTPIARTVVGTFEVINKETSLSAERNKEFSESMGRSTQEQGKMLTDYNKHSLEANIKSGEDADGAMSKEITNMQNDNNVSSDSSLLKELLQIINPNNFMALAIHSLASLLVGIIQVVILGVGVVIVKVLVILGPFVFAFSILPVFQKQLSNWFGTLCSACMVFTVINILNAIMWHTMRGIYDSNSFNLADEATKQLQYLGMDLAMIGTYCSCFWLSSKIVGHGDAGKIISKAVSIVTTAATMAIAGTAMAGKAASNVGSAASLGKSIIED